MLWLNIYVCLMVSSVMKLELILNALHIYYIHMYTIMFVK